MPKKTATADPFIVPLRPIWRNRRIGKQFEPSGDPIDCLNMAENKPMENEQEQVENHNAQTDSGNESLKEKDNQEETDLAEETADDKQGGDFLSRMGFKSKNAKFHKELEELKQQLGEQKEQNLRLYAEFENFKKRNAKDRIEWFKSAGQEVIQSLLPVLDDFERAVKTLENSNDIDAVKEGIKLIQHKLKNTLEQRGLSPIESIGKEFNTDEHEAVTEIPAPTDDMKGKVVDEVERGYKLNEKIIRYAKVIVGK